MNERAKSALEWQRKMAEEKTEEARRLLERRKQILESEYEQ
jgi:hypothetical protein